MLTLNGTDTVQPDVFKAYLDGVEFGSGEGSQLWSHGDDTGVGGLNGGSLFHDGESGGGDLAGAVDDLRIYNRELSAQEAADLATD